ncbi:MAG: MoxR family ATPase [Candidatus Lokiarchaeota archaeon]|nr:MoxR family ATPase [Candidatus Lokiarchaeota archaeon]
MDLDSQVREIQHKYKIVGRSAELKKILIAYHSRKNILLEGEIGTSKTTLARAFSAYMDKNFIRVDGSEDVLSHVLTGYFDPPIVLEKGYNEDAFIYGPLSKAMKAGDVLFINELNRLPESTQNVLLSALDEGFLDIPKLKQLYSKNGFLVITTINPRAHVGTSSLGEALKDRFVWLNLAYQNEEEEIEIIIQKLTDFLIVTGSGIKKRSIVEIEILKKIATMAAKISRITRNHPNLQRSASIRAGIDLATLMLTYIINHSNALPLETVEFWYEAAEMALSTKIELEESSESSLKDVIHDCVHSVLKDF